MLKPCPRTRWVWAAPVVLLLVTACAGPALAPPAPTARTSATPMAATAPATAGALTTPTVPAAPMTPDPATPPPATPPAVRAAYPTAPSPSAADAAPEWAEVAAESGANLRAAPDPTAARLKALPVGAVLLVVGPDREADGRVWRQVRDEGGDEGWVAAELLAEPGTAARAPSVAAPMTAPPVARSPGPPDAASADTGVAAPGDAGARAIRFLVPTIT